MASRDIRIDGFENSIVIPEPTKADRYFARTMKNATRAAVQRELNITIRNQENWRVWYLINRPLRLTADGVMDVFKGKVKSLGFEGDPRFFRKLPT